MYRGWEYPGQVGITCKEILVEVVIAFDRGSNFDCNVKDNCSNDGKVWRRTLSESRGCLISNLVQPKSYLAASLSTHMRVSVMALTW